MSVVVCFGRVSRAGHNRSANPKQEDKILVRKTLNYFKMRTLSKSEIAQKIEDGQQQQQQTSKNDGRRLTAKLTTATRLTTHCKSKKRKSDKKYIKNIKNIKNLPTIRWTFILKTMAGPVEKGERRRTRRTMLNRFLRPFLFVSLLTLMSWIRILSANDFEKEWLNSAMATIVDYRANFDLGDYVRDVQDQYSPQITTVVYELGHGPTYGQTNNQLVAILHALDYALDQHRESNFAQMVQNVSSTSTKSISTPRHYGSDDRKFIISVSGWALKLLELFLQPDSSDSTNTNWKDILEEQVRIVDKDQVERVVPGRKRIQTLKSGEMFYYMQQNYQQNSSIVTAKESRPFDRLEQRRRYVLGILLKLVPPPHWEAYEALIAYIRQQNLPEDYVVVHSRGLDGQCQWRVGPDLADDECHMRPSYIRELLRAHYTDPTMQPTIVVISDMQQKEHLIRLKQDPELGPNVIIPAVDLPRVKHSLVGDMMIAAKSKVFIGPRVSSMSVIIGQMRAALGADLQTNKIFVRESTSAASSAVTGDSKYDICGNCIFYCNNTDNSICGFRPINA